MSPAGVTVAAAAVLLSSAMMPFPMAWDDASPSFTDLSALLPRPAGKHGHVRIRDGHLATDAGRLRLVGVNFAHGANAPLKPQAEPVAARLAKFGVNAARLHMFDAPAPRGILARDGSGFDADALDRFDHFVAQLKKHGVYLAFSLHAIREYDDVARGERMPQHDSGLDNFHRPMIEQQKRFAAALLDRVNPYTGIRYADDPAVALLEINNENALSMRWSDGSIDRAPQAYRDELQALWNDWLRRRHGDTATLRARWAGEPAGAPLIAADSLRRAPSGAWKLVQNRGAQAVVRPLDDAPGPGVAVGVARLGERDFDVMLEHAAVRVDAGRAYTIEFDVRADEPRRFGVVVNHAATRKQLFHRWLEAEPSWRRVRLVFSPNDGGPALVALTNLATALGELSVANFAVHAGGAEGLPADQELGRVAIVARADYGNRVARQQADWLAFLADVEHAYFDEMREYLRGTLKARAPVIGTQQSYSPWPVQARMDVGDVHVYWDTQRTLPGGWYEMNNRPMVTDPNGGVLSTAASFRLAGRPYVVSEFAYRSGNTYMTEADPLVYAYAAFQDWDGVFLFNFSNVANLATDRFRGDEALNGQWNRFVSLVPAALAFHRGDVRPARRTLTVGVSPERLQQAARQHGPIPNAFQLGQLSPRHALRHGVAVQLGRDAAPGPVAGVGDRFASDTGELTWSFASDGGLVTLDTANSQFVSGFVREGEPLALGDARIAFGRTLQGWATATLSAMPPRGEPGRQWLLTVTGRAHNADARFADGDRRFQWGTQPLLIEAVPATVRFPRGADRIEVWALDEAGNPKQRVPVRTEGDRVAFDIGPDTASPWYKIAALPPGSPE